jgi:hypothetical protein
VAEDSKPGWAFLTNHARVLVCIAHDSGIRLRDVGERVGITERAAHRIITELLAAGYITRTRNGRRNQYTINTELPLPDPLTRGQNVGDLLAILTQPRAARTRTPDAAVTGGVGRSGGVGAAASRG